MRNLFLLPCSILLFSNFGCGITPSHTPDTEKKVETLTSSDAGKEKSDSILSISMRLSAFGVEADDFPSINATIDFVHSSSSCTKTYYNPAFKGATYHLSSSEITQVLRLLQEADLRKLKEHYRVPYSDQATSTTTVYTEGKVFTIEDYGLRGEHPLQEMYKIVYKF